MRFSAERDLILPPRGTPKKRIVIIKVIKYVSSGVGQNLRLLDV